MPRRDTSTVDERTVEMRIDKDNFEKGAKETISILEKLEKALKLKGDSSALDDMSKSVSRFDASPIANSFDGAADQISARAIAIKRIIENLADDIYNFAKNTVKDLTIDQISAGMDKYTTLAETTQVLMASTKDYYAGIGITDEAQQLEKINGYLEELMWYTDETSYNFNDMASTAAKFIASGVKIDDAFQAMMGIATWGASAGAKPGDVSHAMEYSIAQAMGTGSMKLGDWKTLENLNMATKEFKDNVLEIAADMGKLSRVAKDGDKSTEDFYSTITDANRFNEEGYIQKLTEKEEDAMFNWKNMRESLKDGWLDTEVMMAVFTRYGEYSEKLYDLVHAVQEAGNDLTASDARDILDAYRESPDTFDWKSYADDLGLTEKKLKELITALDNVEWKVSETGFAMGQEYKTWTDVIDATKDAVSSQWMKTFKYIFGNFLEAKQLWSEVGDLFYEIFAAGLVKQNLVLKQWHSLGGREFLLGTEEIRGALWNLLDAIQSVTKPIKEAFNEVFGLDDTKGLGNKLFELTKRFQEFTAEMGLSEEAAAGLKTIFTEVFSGLQTALGYVGKGFSFLINVLKIAGGLINDILEAVNGNITISDAFINALDAIQKLLPESELVSTVFEKIKTAIKGIEESLTVDGEKKTIFTILKEQLDELLYSVDESGEKISVFKSLFDKVTEAFSKNDGLFSSLFDFSRVESVADSVKAIIVGIGKTIGEVWTGLKQGIKELDIGIGDVVKAFLGLKVGNRIIDSIFSKGTLTKSVTGLIKSIRETIESVGENGLLKTIIGEREGEGLVATLKKIATSLLMVGGALLMIAAAIAIVAALKPEKLLVGIGGLMGTLIGIMGLMLGFSAALKALKINPANLIAISAALALMAVSLILLSGALAAFTLVSKMGNVWDGLLTMAATLAVVGTELAILAKFVSGGALLAAAASILILSAALVVLAGALALFTVVGNMENVTNGLMMMAITLGIVVLGLAALAAAGPMVLAAAGSLLAASVALIVLAAGLAAFLLAVRLVEPALTALGNGIEALGTGIGNGVSAMLAPVKDLIEELFSLASRFADSPEVFGAAILVAADAAAFGVALLPLAAAEFVTGLANAANAIPNLLMMQSLIDHFFSLAEEMSGDPMIFATAVMVANAVNNFGKALMPLAKAEFIAGLSNAENSIPNLNTISDLIVQLFTIASSMRGDPAMYGNAILTTNAIKQFGNSLLPLVKAEFLSQFTNAESVSANFQNTKDIITFLLETAKAFGSDSGIFESAEKVAQASKKFGTAIVPLVGAEFLSQFVNAESAASSLEVVEKMVSLLVQTATDFNSEEGLFDSAKSAADASITFAKSLKKLTSAENKIAKADADEAMNGLAPIESIINMLIGIAKEFASTEGMADSASAASNAISEFSTHLKTITTNLSKMGGTNVDTITPVITALTDGVARLSALGGNLAGASSALEQINGFLDVISSFTSKSWGKTTVDTSGITSIVSAITSSLSELSGANIEQLSTISMQIPQAMANGVTSGTDTFVTAIIAMYTAGTDAMQGAEQSFNTLGWNLMAGLANGIYSGSSMPINAAAEVANAVVGTTQQVFDEHSPSKVFYGIGDYLMQGLSQGIEQNENGPVSSVTTLGDQLIQAIQNSMAQVAAMTNQNFDFQPQITPVVDMSNIRSGAAEYSSLFSGGKFGYSGMYSGISRSIQAGQRAQQAYNDMLKSAPSANASPTDSIVVNVYAAEGQSEESIADSVINRISAKSSRRSVAFG